MYGTKAHRALFSSIYFLRNHESLLFHRKSFAILSMEWGAWLLLKVPLPKREQSKTLDASQCSAEPKELKEPKRIFSKKDQQSLK